MNLYLSINNKFKQHIMKNFFLSFLFILLTQPAFAQVSFAGSPQYGQLRNFVYDQTIPNKVYATTYTDKHIMVSNNNGSSWEVLYTLSYPAWGPVIREMRLTKNGTALSFIQDFGNNSLSKIAVLDLQSLNIIKEFSTPEITDRIIDYSIYDNSNIDTATILTDGLYIAPDKLFYTSNGGATWSTIYNNANYQGVILNAVAMDPVNPQILYLARNGGPGSISGGLLKSTDAGATWTESLNGLILLSIAINPQNSNIIYAGSGLLWNYPTQHQAVYKSLDGGNTWNEQTGISWSGGSSTGNKEIPKIKINPYDTNHVIVMADDRVAVTGNAGSSWTTTIHNGLADGQSYFYGLDVGFNPNNLNQVLIGNSRYPKSSVDKGITLTTMPNPFFTGMGNINLVKDSGADQLIYGVQYGYTVKNLVTNQENPISVLPLGGFSVSGPGTMFVDKKLPGRIYLYTATFSDKNISVSDNYGATLTSIYSTFDSDFTAAETDPSNSNIVWAATFNGANATLLKINFTNLSSPQVNIIGLPYDMDYLNGIKINPNNSNEILITVGNEVFKTTNGGISWTQITAGLQDLTLPNIALSLAQNPLNTSQYTMAASNGIYTSLDGGNTWSRIYNQLIHKVEHSSQQNGQIIGISNSFGTILPKVVYTNNNGANWTERTANNYFNTIVLEGAVRFINTTMAEVYLSTNSLGIVKDVIDFSQLGTSNPEIVKNNISIYPNPAQDVINIRLGKNISKFKVTIYNTTGQVVLTSENETRIDVSHLATGVYIAKVNPENSPTFIKKIIKK